MDDVTNYMNNVGKELDDQKFDLRVTYGELILIRCLAQNPHPAYMEEPTTRRDAATLFEQTKEISEYAKRRYIVNKDVGH